MKKEEILKVVRSNEGTVLSFPDRGPWGNNRYRGNCSGYIHAFLIDQYNVDFMAEMYAGGGTGYDICKDMQVKYVGADLNPIPVRPNIRKDSCYLEHESFLRHRKVLPIKILINASDLY